MIYKIIITLSIILLKSTNVYANEQQLIDSVLNLANFVESHIDSLVECEINPLIVRNLGEKAIVVDALIILKEN